MERRLAAILAADVVGYSRLMGKDEAGTLADLKAHRSELIDPKIAEHRGRVVKLMGDGALVEFASVVDALECAVNIQRVMAERNADVAEERRIEFRIGINIGDIIVEGDDIYGDGVNIASRLESQAEPGGICISRAARDQVRDKLEHKLRDLGEVEVKNISRPVRVFQVEFGETVEMPLRAAQTAEAGKPSIAVLPFENMSRDPEQEYFSDGIAEDIVTELSRFRSLFVIARNSSFAYKGKSLNVGKIGKDLGVRYIVEGSVRKVSQRVRITSQLVETKTGNHLWAERYDRELDDIFSVQDEVTQAIVSTVVGRLDELTSQIVRRKPPESLHAWECYQRGLWHLHLYTTEDSAKAQEYFERAIELDPYFASAHAALGYALYYGVVAGLANETGNRLSRALDAAKRAVSLDRGDAFGQTVLGRVLLMFGEHDESIAAYDLALKLNPNYANAYYGKGFTLCIAGHPEEAIPCLEQAARLSPQDPLMHLFIAIKSLAFFLLERDEEAVLLAGKATRMANANMWAFLSEATALSYLGRIDEAHTSLKRILEIKSDFSSDFLKQLVPWKKPAHVERILDGLHRSGFSG